MASTVSLRFYSFSSLVHVYCVCVWWLALNALLSFHFCIFTVCCCLSISLKAFFAVFIVFPQFFSQRFFCCCCKNSQQQSIKCLWKSLRIVEDLDDSFAWFFRFFAESAKKYTVRAVLRMSAYIHTHKAHLTVSSFWINLKPLMVTMMYIVYEYDTLSSIHI